MNHIPKDAYVVIIGAMKSGTSTLYQYLARHPQICSCITKEPEYFSENQGHRVNGFASYENLWRFDPEQHRYVLEASTGYTKYPQEQDVARRMQAYGIVPKLIYVVRDPFSRIESDYNWSMTKEWFKPRQRITSDRYVCISDYYTQLQQYRELFGRERILVLDFNELTREPESLLSRVARFLDLDKLDLPSAEVFRHETPRLCKGEMFVYRTPVLRTLYLKSSPRLQRAIQDRVLRRFTPVAPKRRLTEDERQIVFEKLRDGMKRFQAEYGFDVTQWGFDGE